MGLLEKRNPRATRRSVIAWAIGCAIVSTAFGLVLWSRTDMPFWSAFLVLPWMGVGGALCGGALEWQVRDDLDDENNEPEHPNRGQTKMEE